MLLGKIESYIAWHRCTEGMGLNPWLPEGVGEQDLPQEAGSHAALPEQLVVSGTSTPRTQSVSSVWGDAGR